MATVELRDIGDSEEDNEVDHIRREVEVQRQLINSLLAEVQDLKQQLANSSLYKIERSELQSPVQEIEVKQKERNSVLQFLHGRRWDLFKYTVFNLSFIGLIIYIVYAVRNYQNNLANPITSLSIYRRDVQPLPQVTVCNWNIDVPCSFCGIEATDCFRNMANDTYEDCYDYLRPVVFSEVSGDFHCWQFNWNTSNILSSSAVGYGGSISIEFTIDPVPKTEQYARTGVQVSFTPPGVKPDLYSEMTFAQPGQETFFTLTKIEENKIDSDTEHRWDKVSSALGIPRLNNTDKTSVVISFGYNTLSVTQINQTFSQQPEQIAADIVGMTGTLTGIDAVKFVIMMVSIPYSFMVRNMDAFFDLIG